MGLHCTIRHFPDKSDTGEHTLPGIGLILSGHALFGLIETVYIMEKKQVARKRHWGNNHSR